MHIAASAPVKKRIQTGILPKLGVSSHPRFRYGSTDSEGFGPLILHWLLLRSVYCLLVSRWGFEEGLCWLAGCYVDVIGSVVLLWLASIYRSLDEVCFLFG